MEDAEELWSTQKAWLPDTQHLARHNMQGCLCWSNVWVLKIRQVKTDVRQGCLLSSFLSLSVIDGSLGGYHKQEQSNILDILNATRWSRIYRWPGICKSQPQMQDKTFHLATKIVAKELYVSMKKTEPHSPTNKHSLWWAHKRSWVIYLS